MAQAYIHITYMLRTVNTAYMHIATITIGHGLTETKWHETAIVLRLQDTMNNNNFMCVYNYV